MICTGTIVQSLSAKRRDRCDGEKILPRHAGKEPVKATGSKKGEETGFS
jgi:hypothetical protein